MTPTPDPLYRALAAAHRALDAPTPDPLRESWKARLRADKTIAEYWEARTQGKLEVEAVRQLVAALVQPAPALTPDPLREALLDILDLSKGEPSMGGGTSFPANAHRMGRIHNRARDAFGDLPLNIL